MSETTHQTQTTHQNTQPNQMVPQAIPTEDVFMILRQTTNTALPIKPKGILQLQRLIGNQATRRVLLQRQGDAYGEETPASAVVYGAEMPLVEKTDRLSVGKEYNSDQGSESISSTNLLPKTILAAFDKYIEQNPKDPVAEKYRNKFSIAQSASSQWIPKLEQLFPEVLPWVIEHLVKGLMKQDQAFVDQMMAGTTKVDYLDEDQRQQYHATGNGSNLLYDKRPNTPPVNTSNMFSLGSGPGFGIFVMDGSDLYVGEHKGAQFHHSSFLAGGDADSAGELCTDSGGKVLQVTNKSGHYLPTEAHLATMLQKLGQMVNLSEAKIASMKPKKTYDNINAFMRAYHAHKNGIAEDTPAETHKPTTAIPVTTQTDEQEEVGYGDIPQGENSEKGYGEIPQNQKP